MNANYVHVVICMNIESVVGLRAVGVNENYVHVVICLNIECSIECTVYCVYTCMYIVLVLCLDYILLVYW